MRSTTERIQPQKKSYIFNIHLWCLLKSVGVSLEHIDMFPNSKNVRTYAYVGPRQLHSMSWSHILYGSVSILYYAAYLIFCSVWSLCVTSQENVHLAADEGKLRKTSLCRFDSKNVIWFWICLVFNLSIKLSNTILSVILHRHSVRATDLILLLLI